MIQKQYILLHILKNIQVSVRAEKKKLRDLDLSVAEFSSFQKVLCAWVARQQEKRLRICTNMQNQASLS